MKKVFSAPVGFYVHNLKNILETHGLECEVHGEDRVAGMGDIPPTECWIELWLVDDSREEEAFIIIDKAIKGEPDEGDIWDCASCGERIEPQFSHCWNCGAERE